MTLCGIMRGADFQREGETMLEYGSNTNWTTPLYSCASVSKASIKTVTFAFNGSHDLSNLKVLGYIDKSYANDESLPHWGIESVHPLTPAQDSPLWGFVSP